MRFEDIPKGAQLRIGDRLEMLGVTDQSRKRLVALWAWENGSGINDALRLCDSVVSMINGYTKAPSAADVADAMGTMDSLVDGNGDRYVVVAEVTVRKLVDRDGLPAIVVDFDGSLPISDVYGMLSLEAAKLRQRYVNKSLDDCDGDH